MIEVILIKNNYSIRRIIMRTYRIFPFCLVCIVLLSECHSGSTKFIAPPNRKKVISDASLLIAPIQKMSFSISDDIANEIKMEMNKEGHRIFFNANLKYWLKSLSSFQEIYPGVYPDKKEFDARLLDLGNDYERKIHIPKSVNWIDTRFTGDGFILFLEGLNLYVTKEQKDTSKPGYQYSVSGNSKDQVNFYPLKHHNYYIQYDIKYALLTQDLNSFVSYGKINAKRQLKDRDKLNEVLQHNIKNIVQKILAGTPFTS